MIPYRAKNPPESYPYATLGLIAVNALVYLVTSDHLLTIKEGVIADFAISHATIGPVRLLTAIFLHGNLLQLLGNLLFLWIFGAAAEGRLGPFKFLAIYLLSGIAGGLLHDVVIGSLNPHRFALGAPGAIMGIAGAYLYMFPFAKIRVWLGWGHRLINDGSPVVDWQPSWAILYYLVFDVVVGVVGAIARPESLAGGIVHFAHLGGFAAGYLSVLALRVRRDTEEASEAQAQRAELDGDHRLMTLHDLEALMEREPENPEIVEAFVEKAMRSDGGHAVARRMLDDRAELLLAQGNSRNVARYILALDEYQAPLPASFLMGIAGKLEIEGDPATAERMYRLVIERQKDASAAEMALMRLGRLLEKGAERERAVLAYRILLRDYPNSPHIEIARAALRRLDAPTEPAPVEPPAVPGDRSTPSVLAAQPPSVPRPAGEPLGDAARTAEESGLRPLGG